MTATWTWRQQWKATVAISDMAAAMGVDDSAEEPPEGHSIDEAAATGGAARVLNQDEIDSLLGFDMDGDGSGEKSGIKAIINSALVNYERLPMLEVVFDRLVRMMTTSLRNFTSDNVEVSLDNITSIPIWGLPELHSIASDFVGVPCRRVG